MPDENAAQQLADVATKAVLQGPQGPDVYQFMLEHDPPAETIAAAMAKAAVNISPVYADRANATLRGFLQWRLTRDHVEAQRKMGEAADKLAGAANRLTALGVVVALVALAIVVCQLRGWL